MDVKSLEAEMQKTYQMEFNEMKKMNNVTPLGLSSDLGNDGAWCTLSAECLRLCA